MSFHLVNLAAKARQSVTAKIGTALALAFASDFLLYDRTIGWNLAVFTWLFLPLLVLHNGTWLRGFQGKVIITASLLMTLAFVEAPGLLAGSLVIAGAVALALPPNHAWPESAAAWVKRLYASVIQLPYRIVEDAYRLRRVKRHRPRPCFFKTQVRGWVLPIVLGAVFSLFLVQANPVIDSWFPEMDWWWFISLLHPLRHVFWLVSLILFWAFLRPRLSKIQAAVQPPIAPKRAALSYGIEHFFSAEAVFRSLVLFNLIFLAQTFTDITYLWSGSALPEGLSYAGYAHRGAYPLIATALLAGAFTVIAFRDGGAAQKSKAIRYLVYLWIGQNIFLTVNSIWRTLNYVEVYGLTYLRVAALIWMGLVASGLALIIYRIARARSETWLANANAVCLLAVLGICSFLNFGGIVADFNVRNSEELGGAGQRVDLGYIEQIGPEALPALQLYLRETSFRNPNRRLAEHLVKVLERDLLEATDNWRSWSFRRQRLLNSLQTQRRDDPQNNDE
ncbi:DUF4173 domain-containing protein [Pelagibius sp. Alg239-R121]|uniref:DUF4153 domain-containing protein n=1 Tax=Pelagibius sp. Alg239-R121 TaxID=2993448 RepID=UPI0024A7415D|nr:DUF4173 domain-containing protein [Pelagibius sp. Alg239-R121]